VRLVCAGLRLISGRRYIGCVALAHLVFDRKQVLAISKIDDIAEAVLILGCPR